MKYLNINTLLIAVLVLILGSGIVSYYFQAKDPYAIPTGNLPVPIEVGKSKIYVSKTGDASMSTEYKRRRAIIGSNSCGLTPKFSYQGSTNGSLESYFISGLCPTFNKVQPPISVIYDGGDAYDEFTYILDGNAEDGYVLLDLGNAYTTVCGV
jgi:hypothetical protein